MTEAVKETGVIIHGNDKDGYRYQVDWPNGNQAGGYAKSFEEATTMVSVALKNGSAMKTATETGT